MTTEDFGGSAVPDMSSAPAQAPVSQPSTPAPERTFSQSEVNDLVGRVKRETQEKTQRLQVEQPQYAEQKYAQTQAAPQQAPQPDIRGVVAEEIQRSRQEWYDAEQRRQQESEVSRVASDFQARMRTGKDKYQDFESVTADVPFHEFPGTVWLSNLVDNTSDVMYELAKEPAKLAQLELLAQKSPALAEKQLKKISEAIKTNEAATKMRQPNAPLEHMRPTNAGVDSGEWSIAAAKNKYRS